MKRKKYFSFHLDTKNINDEPIPDDFTANITLFDTVYHPYAHSYLCWGKNEALKRHRAHLFNAALNTTRTNFSNATRIRIRDPCLARGLNDTLSINSIFHSPCTANEKEKLNNYMSNSLFIFVGTGNSTLCQQRLTNLFDAKRNDTTANCSYKQEYCTFDHTFQPKLPKNIHFIGLSGYYYIFNNLAYGNSFRFIFMNKRNNLIVYLGMANPSRLSTERYNLKDFSRDEIVQRLTNVVSTIEIISI
jgi:hypothetical protein